LLRNSRVIIKRSPSPWLGIHSAAARQREAWDHAELLHNILNSLRGEAVPEQGAMHGSAIQVSRQITSPQRLPDDMCTVQRFVFCQHWSEAVRGLYHLGRWKDLPASLISDDRHGTGEATNHFGGLRRKTVATARCGLNCGLSLASSPISFPPVKPTNFFGALNEADWWSDIRPQQ
jgi:hypothetical protein